MLDDARQAELRETGESSAISDEVLAQIWRRQGFDAPPVVVPPEQLDEVVAQGGVEVWRGISGTQAAMYAETFRTGDPFPGLGVFGSGTYTAANPSTARGFAAPPGSTPGVLMRMALLPGARTITTAELAKLQGEQMRALSAEEGIPFGYPMRGGRRALFNDPGRFAAALGYDAIVVDRSGVAGGAAAAMSDGGDDTYYVVLNRSALAVQNDDLPPV